MPLYGQNERFIDIMRKNRFFVVFDPLGGHFLGQKSKKNILKVPLVTILVKKFRLNYKI